VNVCLFVCFFLSFNSLLISFLQFFVSCFAIIPSAEL
jgi:hypothetical protein